MTDLSEEIPQPVTEWTYWCPPEGSHLSHPKELWVGIVRGSEPLLVAAVVPAVLGQQMEAFAIAIRDALAANTPDWTRPDHLADGLAASGFPLGRGDWPAALTGSLEAKENDD